MRTACANCAQSQDPFSVSSLRTIVRAARSVIWANMQASYREKENNWLFDSQSVEHQTFKRSHRSTSITRFDPSTSSIRYFATGLYNPQLLWPIFPFPQLTVVGNSLISPPITLVHAMLKRYGWEFMSPWLWKHSITHVCVSLNKSSPHWCSSAESVLHQLREGFRAHFWNERQNSQRSDNICCPVMDYNSQRFKLALKQVSGCPDRFAVLTGAYCSPAAYGV